MYYIIKATNRICFGRRRITKSIVRNFMKKNKQLRIIGMTK